MAHSLVVSSSSAYSKWNKKPALFHYQTTRMRHNQGHYMWIEGSYATWNYWGFRPHDGPTVGDKYHDLHALFRIDSNNKILYLDDFNYDKYFWTGKEQFEGGRKRALQKYGMELIKEVTKLFFGEEWKIKIWFDSSRVKKREIFRISKCLEMLPFEIVEKIYTEGIWDGTVSKMNMDHRMKLDNNLKRSIVTDEKCMENKCIITYLK